MTKMTFYHKKFTNFNTKAAFLKNPGKSWELDNFTANAKIHSFYKFVIFNQPYILQHKLKQWLINTTRGFSQSSNGVQFSLEYV